MSPSNKPPNTIRIAFVGASTTVDAFGVPFSHPELVGYWLNRWAAAKGLPYRFDVINAGRMGIDSNSIAAVVTQELVPVEPDLVIYYEGANQLWPGQLVSVDDARSPRATQDRHFGSDRRRRLLRRWCRRVIALADRLQARGGYEPSKPASRINWPAEVDEADPALGSPKLPMDLPNIVACLDIIRTALAEFTRSSCCRPSSGSSTTGCGWISIATSRCTIISTRRIGRSPTHR